MYTISIFRSLFSFKKLMFKFRKQRNSRKSFIAGEDGIHGMHYTLVTTATQKKCKIKIDRVHLLPSGVPGPNVKSDSRVNRS